MCQCRHGGLVDAARAGTLCGNLACTSALGELSALLRSRPFKLPCGPQAIQMLETQALSQLETLGLGLNSFFLLQAIVHSGASAFGSPAKEAV